jgi:glycosyltransferase involved in cell wall biosynthesis
MKVLHVINAMTTGGAEKLLLDTIPLYNAKAIQSDVLVLNGDSYPFLTVLKSLNCCNVYSLGNKSVYNPIHVIKIIPYLKKYDIIHVHLFPSQYWVAMAKLLCFSRVKIVYTEHSTSSRRFRKKIFKIIDPVFYRPYSRIICIAESTLQALKKHINLPEKKLVVINNGVDISKFKNADALTQDFFPEPDSKILIQVSSFIHPKDQATVIRALKHLPVNVKLLLVGQGEMKAGCEMLVKELGLENRVLFLGVRMDVAQLLKMANIIILSSQYEGLSLSSIEGMASGRPLIASDVDGLSDIVGGAGVLFPFNNDVLLAQQVMKLLDNQNYYNNVVKSCLNRAATYDIDTMINSHITLYNSLINNSKNL